MGATFPASPGRRGDHPMTCPFCGKADNPAHAKFCSHCGTALLPVQPAQPQPAQPMQPAPAGEPAQASPMSEARASALPGRSRHGFLRRSGQPPGSGRSRPRRGACRSADPFRPDRRCAAERRMSSRPRAISTSATAREGGLSPGGPSLLSRWRSRPCPSPHPSRYGVRRSRRRWSSGSGRRTSASAAAPPPAEPLPAPPVTAGAPEPDPVSRSFGTWESPPAPTARPDFSVAAQQALDARAVDAANYSTTEVDLTTCPRPLSGATAGWGARAGMPVAPAPAVPERPARPSGGSPARCRGEVRPDGGRARSRAAGRRRHGDRIQDAVDATSAESAGPLGGERVRHGQDLGRNASRSDQARSAGDTGGPAGPVGPNDAAGTGRRPAAGRLRPGSRAIGRRVHTPRRLSGPGWGACRPLSGRWSSGWRVRTLTRSRRSMAATRSTSTCR